MNVNILLMCTTVAAAMTGVAPGFATPPAAMEPEVLFLDTFETPNDKAAGPVSTHESLTNDLFHFVTVDGTYAFNNVWGGERRNRVNCGQPEAAPTYPTTAVGAGRTTGPVGADAETVFASAVTTPPNACPTNLPRSSRGFQMELGDGTFRHYDAVGGPYTRPRADHTYTYIVRGTGEDAAFDFRLSDSPTTDNYGKLRIIVRAADAGDCDADAWRQFSVFKNRGDCVSYFATFGRNAPARG